MAHKKRQLRFPILRRVEVDNYPMYPGGGKGLSKDFQPGANVIVGINGVGKTTLLILLLRMILGIYDPKKADANEPGAKLHELTYPSKFDFFAARIAGDARPSTGVVELSFGKDKLRIARNLGPKLEIKELRLNGALIKVAGEGSSLEDRYLELVADLSGIPSHYDFDFVVRNLLFFLEDKVPLIWNPKGQFEILRILFLDDELAAETARLHDQVMQLDSQYRNHFWALSRMRESHAQATAKAANAPEQGLSLEAARVALNASKERCERLENEFILLAAEVDRARALHFEAEQKANEHVRRLNKIDRVRHD